MDMRTDTARLFICGVLQVFDRPFLFFIVDTVTQTMLLQGAVTDPTPSDASS